MKKIETIRIAMVSSSFRAEVADNLEKNCLKTLNEKGVKKAQVTIVRVPGALEIPLIVQQLGKTQRYDAIITFGAIVKGKTYHFEQIADECIRGCMDVSWMYEVPVIFEVLAVYDLKDAMDRATRKVENKGVEAAESALAMIEAMDGVG
ncbi:MAG TPA: 6,7-dimethyl-8-ribityllumazine synthase [Candidatus Dormibacteraeota bacterium]|nr:6,7-dimethyl-8-ribityllumazine synthase [Candidatus Dormibacteraeota bacterium]